MTTPLTITSLSQGKIAPRHDTDEQYWAQFRDAPKQPRRVIFNAPRWLLHRRATGPQAGEHPHILGRQSQAKPSPRTTP